jgi:hypothetical protein
LSVTLSVTGDSQEDSVVYNPTLQFSSVTVYHGSLNVGDYDYLLVNFQLPFDWVVSTAAADEFYIRISLTSEYFSYNTSRDYQDLSLNTDTNLYANELLELFRNGQDYGVKIY